jgi:Lon protease-like protein
MRITATRGDGSTSLTQKESSIMPLFPLGGIVYTPNSEHMLTIFEPRYREMYTDILMNGSKRFVVAMSHPTEPGRFAEMGVLFELDDLKEVSEQTGDKIKYICSHKVTGRVKLHRILNPKAWESRTTYLRVEGTIFDDSGKDNGITEAPDEVISDEVYGVIVDAVKGMYTTEEKALRDAFNRLVDLQHECNEDVRFTKTSGVTLAVKPGAGEDGLWRTVRLWQSFADQRLAARQNELQRGFQAKLQEFLKKEKGLKENELPRYM